MKKLNWFSLLALFCGCLIFAACSGNDGEGEEPGGGGGGTSLDGKLVLSASAAFINSDGQDASEFTVKKGDTDITDKATIYQGSTVFNGTSFATNKAGEYTFFATYEGEISDKITITAIDGMPDMPKDPQPAKFDGFKQRVLAVQSTGTWCQFCPYMMAGIESYLKSNKTGDAVFAAAHNADIMASKSSDIVNNWLKVPGFPYLSFNLDSKNKVDHTATPDATAKAIERAVSATMKETVSVGISASVNGTESEGALTVSASVKIGADGQYRIAAWLLEDGIKANQTNSTGLTGDFSTHNNVLRLSSAKSAYGDKLGQSDNLKKGSIEKYICTLNLEEAEVASLAKCRVVILVTTPKNGKFVVDNVITCPINGSIAFEYE